MRGERNSGTVYLHTLLTDNTCNGLRWDGSAAISGGKHGSYRPSECPQLRRGDELQAVIARNVFDWVVSMWRYPVHAGFHCELLTLNAFISTPWGPPPNGSRSWHAQTANATRCNGYALYPKRGGEHGLYPGTGGRGGYARSLLAHRAIHLRSWLEAKKCAPEKVLLARHEDLAAEGGRGFATVLRAAAVEGGPGRPGLKLSPCFPRAVERDTGRVKTNQSTPADDTLRWPTLAAFNAGRWPSFDPTSFRQLEKMVKKRPVVPTFDHEVLATILGGIDPEVEAAFGYNYSVAARMLARSQHS